MKRSPMKSRLAIALGCVGLSTSAAAGYEVTAFGDTPGFEQIMEKDYAGASARLAMRNYEVYRYATLANLCISRLMSHDVEGALSSCNQAVNVAPSDLTSSLAPMYHKRSEVMTHLYSNRGVVRAVSGDLSGARSDFVRALELDENNGKAQRNLELVAAGDLAQGAD